MKRKIVELLIAGAAFWLIYSLVYFGPIRSGDRFLYDYCGINEIIVDSTTDCCVYFHGAWFGSKIHSKKHFRFDVKERLTCDTLVNK